MKKISVVFLMFLLSIQIVPLFVLANPAPQPIIDYRHFWEFDIAANESILINSFDYFNRSLFDRDKMCLEFQFRSEYYDFFKFNDSISDNLSIRYYFINKTHVNRYVDSNTYYPPDNADWFIYYSIEEEYSTCELVLNITNLEDFDYTFYFKAEVVLGYEWYNEGNIDSTWWKSGASAILLWVFVAILGTCIIVIFISLIRLKTDPLS